MIDVRGLIQATCQALSPAGEPGNETHAASRYKSLFDAFTEAADNVVGDDRFAKRVSNYLHQLKTKNADHINWYGGNLLGVDRIKFLDSDNNRWFDEVLEVDEDYLRECIYTVPSINEDWNVSSDVFNLSCVWALHRLVTSNNQSKLVKQAQIDVGVILQFKYYTSIWYNFFDKPVDKAAAEATYQALSLKFRLRQLGSWGALMEYQAAQLIDPKGVRATALKTFAEDKDVIVIVTDINTRCRAVVKDMYGVLDQVRSSNSRINTMGATVISVDGDKIIRDTNNFFNTASYYLKDMASNPTNFIRNDLVQLVVDLMPTANEKALVECLVAIANAPEGESRRKVNWMLEMTLQHAFEYIASNRLRVSDAAQILAKLRAIYTSSTSKAPLLIELREQIEKFAKKNCFLNSSSALASVRTALMLYFVVRSLAVNMNR